MTEPTPQPPSPAAASVPGDAVAAHDGGAERVRPEHLYKTAALLLLLALVFRFFDTLSHTLLLAYAAALVAVALNAVVRVLPVQRKWVAAGVGLLVVGGVAAALAVGIPLLLEQAKGLVTTAGQFEEMLGRWEATIREQTGLPVNIPSNAPQQVAQALGGGGGRCWGAPRPCWRRSSPR